MWRKKANEKIITVFNMALAVIASVIVGLVFGNIFHAKWVVMGSVSVVAVLSEHYLTLYPLSIIKYITLPTENCDENMDEKAL